MAIIKCGAVCCKHNSSRNICTNDYISLSECYYHTVNEGFQHFWRCREYEQCEWAESMEKMLKSDEEGE